MLVALQQTELKLQQSLGLGCVFLAGELLLPHLSDRNINKSDNQGSNRAHHGFGQDDTHTNQQGHYSWRLFCLIRV